LFFFAISINRGQTGKGTTKATNHTAIGMTTTKLKNKDVTTSIAEAARKKENNR